MQRQDNSDLMGDELIFHLPYKACLHVIKITAKVMYRYKATCSLSLLCVQKGILKGRRIKDFCFFLLILTNAIRKYALFLNMSMREENKEIMICDTGLS